MKIDSKNKKIVIFSDVHNDIHRVKNIIKEESADLNICLGDWFDSFEYDTSKDYKETASYLLEYLNNDKNISLWGNHDLHYIADNKSTLCSGYENWKYIDIDGVIANNRGNVKNKLKWFIRIDDWLCTHAGLHANHLPAVFNLKTNENINDDIDNFLSSQSLIADIKLNTNERFWFWEAGRARGGRARFGGIVWLDFNREFDPIDNVKQIVGHTPRYYHEIECHKTEGYLDALDGSNICIDTGLNQYITITDGKMERKYYNDL